ncbi:MAG: phosphatidylglycerophosphatase A [Bdellovibrionia bacterium]
MNKLLDHLATGFQVGRLGYAPGTFGTLWGIPLAWILSRLGPFPYVLGSLAITLGSIFVAEWYEVQNPGAHDSSEVVIDEVAGFVTAMALIPFEWQTCVAAFVLFRLFDIVKPYPISYLDKNIKGGLGVVADDIAAGVATNICMQIIVFRTTFLGVY